MSLIVVKAAYDPEAKVWFVEESDLPGLNVETDTIETMIQQLPLAIADLLENTEEGAREVPIELIAHARTRVRIGGPA